MAALATSDRLRAARAGEVRQPQFRYPAVLALMLAAVVFLIAAPSANWSRALGIAIEGSALVLTVATSRDRESVRRRRAFTIGVAMLGAVILIAAGLLPVWLTA